MFTQKKRENRSLAVVLGAVAVSTVAAANPYLFMDIDPNGNGWPSGMTWIGDVMVFNANDGIHGQELWRSNGTVSGTYLLKDIVPGADGSVPAGFIRAGQQVFFIADDNVQGYEYWVTDGTAGGTLPTRDVDPDPNGSDPGMCSYHTRPDGVAQGLLYFRADDDVTGYEPWISDGTADGTLLLKDIRPGSSGSFPQAFAEVAGSMFFAASSEVDEEVPGYDLWKSDGTEAGTVRLRDLSGAIWITDVNGTAFFTSDDGPGGVLGEELFKSDGTPDGTVLVKDIWPGPNWSSPYHLVNYFGTLIFSAEDGTHGYELWKSDGTAEGTVMVKDINPGSAWSFPESSTLVGNVIFFEADDGEHGVELWKTDGTEEGTLMVRDINPGGDSDPHRFTAGDGLVYFEADDGVHGMELWVSDGTEEGTRMLGDIRPGADGSYPTAFVYRNGVLYFLANDGAHGLEMWVYDSDPDPIPTVSQWGLAVMLLSLLIGGTAVLRHRGVGAAVTLGNQRASGFRRESMNLPDGYPG
jgi:ELWxxDGT repeat protein